MNKDALARHEHIKAALRIGGNSLSKLGAEIGVSGSAMSAVSMGKSRSAKIEAAIATALKTTPASLWPDRFEDTQISEHSAK
jgi:lambda repressor-like predicted transcriptional regulator